MLPENFFKGSTPIALVAGGAGFIGSHICETLLVKGAKVICVDNWQTGLRENIKGIRQHRNFYLLEKDVNEKLPKKILRLDWVIHLAGVEAYLNAEDVSIATLETNSLGTKNLLDLANKHSAKFLLASTIGVYSASLSQRSVLGYFGKTRSEEGEYSHHEAKRFAEALASEYQQKRGVDVRIVRLGDVYGPKMMLSSGSPLAQLIKQAVWGKPLVVDKRKVIKVFPVYITDVVEGMQKVLFSAQKGEIVSLAGQSTDTVKIAALIKSIKEGEVEIETKGEQLRVSLQEGLEKTINWFAKHEEAKPEPLPQNAFWENVPRLPGDKGGGVLKKNGNKQSLFHRNKRYLFLVSLFFFALAFWFFLLPFVLLGAGIAQLYLAKKAFLTNKEEQALLLGRGAGFLFSASKASFLRWGSIPFLEKPAGSLSDTTRMYTRTAGVSQGTAEILHQVKIIARGVLTTSPPEDFSLEGSIEVLGPELENLDIQLAFLETEKTPAIGSSLDFKSLRRPVAVFKNLLPFLPVLLGQEGKKNYLVLFHDKDNVALSGLRIDSFALASFEDLRLVDFKIFDPDSVNSQLKGRVAPPEPLKKYALYDNWKFEDSLWSPNFPSSAKKAAWFLAKSLEVEVDGVLVLEKGFKDVGRKLPDYKLQNTALDIASYINIKDLISGLEQRQAALWVSSENMSSIFQINSIFKKAGWDGSLKPSQDYLQIVAGNLSKTTTSEKKYSLDVSIEEKRLVYKLAISYEPPNASSSLQETKEYLRIYTPGDSKLINAVMVNPDLIGANPDSSKQQNLLVEETQESDKKVFGFLVSSQYPNSQAVIVWEREILEKGNNKSLDFLWQKQLGYSYFVWLNFSAPEGYELLAKPEGALTQDSQVGYNMLLSGDFSTQIQWQENKY